MIPARIPTAITEDAEELEPVARRNPANAAVRSVRQELPDLRVPPGLLDLEDFRE